MKGNLYLIPTSLGATASLTQVPVYINEILKNINEFIVEDEKLARRYLIKLGTEQPINQFIFHILNEHTEQKDIHTYLNNIEKGKNIGLLSDAGTPCIADPGATIVKIAHQKNIKVIPLIGPSSIILALMASGFNGQNFSFLGYLPKDKTDRTKKLKEIERASAQKNQTQIFIETPYRNLHLLETIINTCDAHTQLCIACDLTLPTEFIKTNIIAEWKKKTPDINKRPAVFLIYAEQIIPDYKRTNK